MAKSAEVKLAIFGRAGVGKSGKLCYGCLSVCVCVCRVGCAGTGPGSWGESQRPWELPGHQASCQRPFVFAVLPDDTPVK